MKKRMTKQEMDEAEPEMKYTPEELEAMKRLMMEDTPIKPNPMGTMQRGRMGKEMPYAPSRKPPSNVQEMIEEAERLGLMG